MEISCDNCGKRASISLTDISPDGQKITRNLCDECAAKAGLAVKTSLSITQLLEDFVLQSAAAPPKPPALQCELCGMTYEEFRQKSLLGCPHDYDRFAPVLMELIEQAQDGANQHVGKVPARATTDQKRTARLMQLRVGLKKAIADEDYETAATLRDQIKELENS